MVCQMCGNYSKYEIMKHNKKGHVIFFISNHFKPLLEKAKPTLVDRSSDKPKAPIRNVGSQTFHLRPLTAEMQQQLLNVNLQP